MNVDSSALQIEEQSQNNVATNAPEEMQEQPFYKKWGGLVILSLALAIIIIDTTLLNVSLRTIITDLKTDLKSMQWVITIYSLILAAFTITGGRLGDFFGRKRMFLVGAVIFAVGSFIASISTNVGMMIAGEAIIEGIGAALMMPATSSLLVTNFKGRDRAIAFGVWGGIAAASSAIGPILGGWLTTNYSWRWGFRINIFVVALVLIGSYLIKENHSLRQKVKIDFVGILLSSLGLLSVVFAFIQASTYGWFKAKEQFVFLHHTLDLGSLSATPLFLVLGLLILTAFIFWERYYEGQGKTPLLSLHLFKNNQFVAGASTMAVLALGQAGLFFTIPVFLQAVRGLDALHTGLTLLPMSLSLLVAAPLSAFLNKYIKPKRLIQIGLSLSILAFIILRASLSVDATAWTLALGFIIFGFGMGLIMAQVSNLTLSSVPVTEAGEASGVNNTLRMVGQTLGSAILGAILLSALVSNVTKGIEDSSAIPDQAKQSIVQNVENNVSSISFGAQDESAQSNTPKVVRDAMTSIINQSTVDANKTVMVYGALFVLLGLLVSTRLSNGTNDHGESNGGSKSSEEDEEKFEVAEFDTTDVGAIEGAASNPDLVVSKNTAKWLLGAAGLIIAILAIVALSVGNNKDDNKNNNVAVVVETSPNIDSNNSNTNTSDANTRDVNSNTNTESNADVKSAPSPEELNQQNVSTPTSTPTSASTTSNSYNNSDLHFSFNPPSDWKIVKNSNGEVVFKAANGLYNIQSAVASGGMDSLKTFLQKQSNISNVELAKFGNRDAYKFNIAGTYKSGYAFLEQGRLYYVLGEGSETTPIRDLLTF